MPRLLIALLTIALTGCTAPAPPPVQESAPQPAPRAQKQRRSERVRGESGKFDFYVLSLSWSPGYCATPAGQHDDAQCGPTRHFAFVLHGLWPQYEQKGWPQNCTNTGGPTPAEVDAMLDIQPSKRLIQHEWEKHGTCSGLPAKDYLEEEREVFQKVKIPEAYKAPLKQITANPADIRQAFAAANPEFGNDGFVVICTNNGRFLQEVRACLTKDLAGRACNAETLRDQCRSDSVIMRPLR